MDTKNKTVDSDDIAGVIANAFIENDIRKASIMKIEKYGWQFNVDLLKTQIMYNKRLKTVIDARSQLPELVNFLSELGIDIEKPDEYHSDLSDLVYTCIGNATSETSYEIDMYGEEQYISIVVSNKNGSIVLEVFGMK